MEKTVEPQMELTFEQVWAAFMETRARQEEFSAQEEEFRARQEESFKEIREMHKKTEKVVKETSLQIKETQKETDRQIKRMSKTLGGLGNSLGQLIETLIAAKLWEKFDTYKYNLKRSYQRVTLHDENNRDLPEIDILLSNGEYVMAVEVKENFHRLDEVDHHLKRMELIKKYPSAECKGKKLLGAIAGGIVRGIFRSSKSRAHFISYVS